MLLNWTWLHEHLYHLCFIYKISYSDHRDYYFLQSIKLSAWCVTSLNVWALLIWRHKGWRNPGKDFVGHWNSDFIRQVISLIIMWGPLKYDYIYQISDYLHNNVCSYTNLPSLFLKTIYFFHWHEDQQGIIWGGGEGVFRCFWFFFYTQGHPSFYILVVSSFDGWLAGDQFGHIFVFD